MNIHVVGDNILFFILGITVICSCGLIIKKYKKDMQRLRQLNLQVVPAVEVVEGVPLNA